MTSQKEEKATKQQKCSGAVLNAQNTIFVYLKVQYRLSLIITRQFSLFKAK